jgi:hypothetical protein
LATIGVTNGRVWKHSPSRCHSERSMPCALAGHAESKNLTRGFDLRDRKSYCVYIMGSLSGTLYIGVTSRPEKRVFQHKEHLLAGFTSKYGADRLLYWESFDDVLTGNLRYCQSERSMPCAFSRACGVEESLPSRRRCFARRSTPLLRFSSALNRITATSTVSPQQSSSGIFTSAIFWCRIPAENRLHP